MCFTHVKLLCKAPTGSITVFSLTEYGEAIHHAITVYSTEKQSEVIEPWNRVLELNANYDLAYVGIGKVLLNQEKYDEAMKYFELGNNSEQYNIAFRKKRLIFIRENIWYFLFGIVLLYVLYRGIRLVRRRKEGN